MMTPKQKATLFSVTTLTLFLAGSIPAQADTVLTFDRETTGSLRPERERRPDDTGVNTTAQPVPTNTVPKQTVTVQLKGALARVEFRPMGAKPETVPATVLLYDGMAQKIYTLDTAGKTYFVQSYKEAIDGEQRDSTNGNGGMATRMTVTGTVELKAARANNAYVSREVLGTQSRQYLVSGNVEMKLNMPEGFSAGSVQGPGVGMPGTPTVNAGGTMQGANGRWNGRRQVTPVAPGGQTRPGRPMAAFTPPTVTVSGEVWSTDGIALFTAGRDTPMAAIYRLMLPDSAGAFGTPLTKPLVARLKSLKSLPGESTVSFQMSSNFRNNADSGNALVETPLTTHLIMKQMTNDATLDDTLFAIPTDFKVAEPPATDFGRRGGIGGGRGPSGGGGRRFGGNQNNE